MDVVRGLVLEDGRTWGEVAAPFQYADAAAVLAADGPRWHFLTRPRGGSKSTDLAAVACAWLAVDATPGARGYLAASDSDQAALIVDAARGLVDRTPGLGSLVRVDSGAIVSLGTAARMDVLAADGASAFGLRPSFVVSDEVAQWPSTRGHRQVWTALISAMGKVPGSRLVVLTSAGEPGHWSAKVLDAARKSIAWRVSEVSGPLPWAAEAFLLEQRALLTESQYARLHLNQWTAAEDRLTSADALAGCVTLDGPLDPVEGVRYIVSLDVGLVNDRTVVVVAHAEGPQEARRVILDRIHALQGSRHSPVQLATVEALVEECSHSYNGAPLVFDPYQSVQLTQSLRTKGVRCIEFTFTAQSVGKLAMALYQLIRAGRLALPPDEDLIDELANVRLKETSPGVFRLDHDSGRHDDRAVALALACDHLLTAVPTKGPRLRFRLPGNELAVPAMRTYDPSGLTGFYRQRPNGW